MAERETSPWVYIGIGCLLAVVLAVGSCVALGWFGMQKAKEMGEAMTDPEQRRERVLESLGAEELPPGYHPIMAFSMPLGVMEMAMLGDEPPETDEEGRSVPSELGSRGFIYIAQRKLGDQEKELRAYLEGESRDRGPLDNLELDVGMDRGEVVKRGRLEIGEVGYLYLIQRGILHGKGTPDEGIATTFMVECPSGNDRLQMGIWFTPLPEAAIEDTSPDEGLDPILLEGTPGDEEALRQFLRYFDLCS
ncbi:MAG: hypothetical protein R3234_12645 [Thermoanaerobaculia bacterium]|nr:hypothetical protein [Thermoanaerobaculia bacterium]